MNNNDEVVVDRRFQLPPNIIDARSQNETDGLSYYDTFLPVEFIEADEGDGFAEPIVAPSSFSVISQTPRSTAPGQYVVDVVIEIPDREGVIDNEVRIAKV